jgi:starch synthase
MLKPYGWTLEETFGRARGVRRMVYSILRDLVPYLATPLVSLARELRRERCKAILCQEYEYGRFDICVALGKLLRIPAFATFQGGNWHLSRFEGLLRPLTMKACAGLIIAAQTEIERVRARYGVPSLKIARIFNPIDLTMWSSVDRNETRAALDIRGTARVAMWHGRVDIHRKGLDILLDAWKKICNERKGRDLQLLLIGTGNDADELHHRMKAMHLQCVTWINKYLTDRAAIRRYLSAADVYVLPSRHEGFPLAPIEAMACSLPAVAADAPGVPDIFEGGEISGGIVVPRGDSGALALALGHILDDASRGRELGVCARRRVETCFSLEAVSKQLHAFLSGRGVAISKEQD